MNVILAKRIGQCISYIVYCQIQMLLFWISIIVVSAKIGEFTISTNSQSTITNFNSDFATCICNLKTSFCDQFCCCDSECSSSLTTQWNSAGVCVASTITTSNLQNQCNSFSWSITQYQNINCIYYNNKNQIGRFYPDPTSLTTSSINKISTISVTYPSTPSSTPYVYGSPVKTSSGSLMFSKNVGGGFCQEQTILIGQNKSYTCYKDITSTNCASLNNFISNNTTFPTIFCSVGDCSSTGIITYTGTNNVTSNSSGCFNVINSVVISIGLSGSSAYIISSLSITFSTTNLTIPSSATLPSQFPVTVSINTVINQANVKSGAPGYLPGKPVIIANSNFTTTNMNFVNSISNSSGNCLSFSVTPTLLMAFLQPRGLMCLPTSCSSPALTVFGTNSSPIYLSKYGDNVTSTLSSNDYIQVSYASRSNTTCQPYRTTLNILYSQSGIAQQLQNYIISASVTYQQYTNSTQFSSLPMAVRVSWIYVDPSTVTGAVVNNFYNYFSKLWIPINNAFNSLHQALYLCTMTVLIFTLM